MRFIILAGGRGTRLGALTASCPKALLTVAGKPILQHILEVLDDPRITEVVVVSGYLAPYLEHTARAFPNHPPLRFIENKFYESTNTLFALSLTRELWSESFCLASADTMFTHDLLNALLSGAADGIHLTVDATRRLDQIDMRVRLRDGAIIDIGKDISDAHTHGESISISRWSPVGATALAKEMDAMLCTGQRDALSQEAMRRVARRRGLSPVFATRSQWCEIDTHEDLAHVRAYWKGGKRGLTTDVERECP